MTKYILYLALVPLVGVCHNVYAVEVGSHFPDCTLTTMNDIQKINLTQYRDKVVYADFWVSWCRPRTKSFPFLNQLHQQLKGQGLQVVAINLDENLEASKAFLAKYPASFTVVADASKQCTKDFDVKAMPSTYIVDRNGIVHHVQIGSKPGETEGLQKMVTKLLSEKTQV